jgi:hypothetical protein
MRAEKGRIQREEQVAIWGAEKGRKIREQVAIRLMEKGGIRKEVTLSRVEKGRI